MPYKPRIVIFLSLVYFFSPPLILIYSSYTSMIPLTGPAGILNRLNPGDMIVLFCYFFISICLFSIRKWGWWGFLFSSLFLIVYNFFGYMKNPFYNPFSLLLYTVLLTLAAALLFRKELIAPYFNPKLRWWETEKRYELSFRCKLQFGDKNLTVPITDISRSGCFVAINHPAPLSRPLTLEISINGLFITLRGEVVRSAEYPVKGWGILFRDLSMMENRGLKELIHLLRFYHGDIADDGDKRQHKRYANPFYVYLGGPAVKGERRIHSSIENFSRSGFCLRMNDADWLTESHEITIELPKTLRNSGITQIEKPFEARIIWSKVLNGNCTIGAEFTDLTKKEKKRIERIVHDFRKMGSRERSREKAPDLRLIQDSLSLTPRGKLQSLISRVK